MGSVAAHIVPGNHAPPFIYAPFRNALLQSCQTRGIALRVNLPYRLLRHVSEIPSYVADMPDWTPSHNILIGHSLGGHAALTTLSSDPDATLKVILMGTPVRSQYFPWGSYLLTRYLVGIDLEARSGPLACIARIEKDPALLGKVASIVGDRDTFNPPEAYTLDGAETHYVGDASHFGYVCSRSTIRVVTRIIAAAVAAAGPLTSATAKK
jgi:pimeloyl-ACP methyl ester carboxylesterase